MMADGGGVSARATAAEAISAVPRTLVSGSRSRFEQPGKTTARMHADTERFERVTIAFGRAPSTRRAQDFFTFAQRSANPRPLASTPMAKSLSLMEKVRRAARDPKRPGEKCDAAPGDYRPVIDHSRCEGKSDCVDVCPHAVFEVRAITRHDFQGLPWLGKLKSMAHGRVTAYAVAPERCRACGLCVVACPERAIELRNASERP